MGVIHEVCNGDDPGWHDTNTHFMTINSNIQKLFGGGIHIQAHARKWSQKSTCIFSAERKQAKMKCNG
jgi:hypothetical protein